MASLHLGQLGSTCLQSPPFRTMPLNSVSAQHQQVLWMHSYSSRHCTSLDIIRCDGGMKVQIGIFPNTAGGVCMTREALRRLSQHLELQLRLQYCSVLRVQHVLMYLVPSKSSLRVERIDWHVAEVGEGCPRIPSSQASIRTQLGAMR